MKKLAMVPAALALTGVLTLTAVPAEAAPKPPREVPAGVIEQLPAPLRMAAESMGTIGWDDKGPYLVWGNLSCRIHLFIPEEWGWAFGTGPCWF